MIETIRRMLAKGATHGEIARRLGIQRGAVRHRIKQHRLAQPKASIAIDHEMSEPGYLLGVAIRRAQVRFRHRLIRRAESPGESGLSAREEGKYHGTREMSRAEMCQSEI